MISSAVFVTISIIFVYVLVVSTYSFAHVVSNNVGSTPLYGDVTGTLNKTLVSSVNGQSSTSINEAVILALAATDQNIPGTLVRRSGGSILSNPILFNDNTSNTNFSGGLGESNENITGRRFDKIATVGTFDIGQINVLGSPTSLINTTTKEYVDTIAVLVPKTPALVISLTNITLSGAILIDGVTTTTGSRILVNGQTDGTQNGIWIANSVGSWTRSTDMVIGSTVGQAAVLITNGTVNAGSTWLSDTPLAIVGTNVVGFNLLILPPNILLGSQVSGILPIVNGGTNSLTALNNNRIMVSTTGTIKEAPALTNGQLLIGSTSAAPSSANITSLDASITVTNGAGTIDLSASASAFFSTQAINSTTTLTANKTYLVDTSGGSFNVTLPALPSVGQYVIIKDTTGSFQLHPLTVLRNAQNIEGIAANKTLYTNYGANTFLYSPTPGSGNSWYIVQAQSRNTRLTFPPTGTLITPGANYSSTWIAPPGVTQITLWGRGGSGGGGGGGGGSGGSTIAAGRGGGAGGSTASNVLYPIPVSVTAGTSYTIQVGGGGTSGSGGSAGAINGGSGGNGTNGGDGLDSYFGLVNAPTSTYPNTGFASFSHTQGGTGGAGATLGTRGVAGGTGDGPWALLSGVPGAGGNPNTAGTAGTTAPSNGVGGTPIALPSFLLASGGTAGGVNGGGGGGAASYANSGDDPVVGNGSAGSNVPPNGGNSGAAGANGSSGGNSAVTGGRGIGGTGGAGGGGGGLLLVTGTTGGAGGNGSGGSQGVIIVEWTE